MYIYLGGTERMGRGLTGDWWPLNVARISFRLAAGFGELAQFYRGCEN